MRAEPKEIMTLVEMFDASDWQEMHLEVNGLQLFLSRDPTARLATAGNAPVQASAPVPAPIPAPPASAAPVSTPVPAAGAGEVPAHRVAITAPHLGTFYRAPKPGDAPFVEPGQVVEPATDLCLLEVMKLFTRMKAGTAGVVRRICKQDSEIVEFGDVLFYVEPD